MLPLGHLARRSIIPRLTLVALAAHKARETVARRARVDDRVAADPHVRTDDLVLGRDD